MPDLNVAVYIQGYNLLSTSTELQYQFDRAVSSYLEALYIPVGA